MNDQYTCEKCGAAFRPAQPEDWLCDACWKAHKRAVNESWEREIATPTIAGYRRIPELDDWLRERGVW